MNEEANIKKFYINFEENLYFSTGLNKSVFKFPFIKEVTIES